MFLRANAASLMASLFDYLVTVILKQLFQVDAVVASITGTIAGGIIHFYICRQWVFKAGDSSAYTQTKRYLLIWTGNLILNALGVYVLIEVANINYIIAKIICSLTIAFTYNYPMHKGYVFKSVNIK